MPVFARETDAADIQPAPAAPQVLADAPPGEVAGLRRAGTHRRYLLSKVASLPPFGIGLLEAAGLTLCETIAADLDLPTFTAATVAGWAVRTSNLVGASEQRPVILPVVDEILAGGYRGAPLTPGTAVRVAAGAPVPDGADAVMPLASGLAVADDVQFVTEARFHQHMRLAGSRIAEGDQLLTAGSRLDPRSLALVAEVGHDKVLARPRPRVVVLTAADNLVDPGLPLTRLSQEYDSCTTMITAAARADGGQAFPAGLVTPAADRLGTVLTEQLVRADLVLLVAEPTEELVALLGRIGQVDVAGVDVLPGVQLFALIGPEQVPLLVLPPRPVEAYLTYLLFGRPLLQQLAGLEPAEPVEASVPTTVPLRPDPARSRLVLGQLVEHGVVPVPGENHGTAELAAADVVIVVPPVTEPVRPDGKLTCWSLA